MGLTTKEELSMLLESLIVGKGICLKLLENLRITEEIISKDFLKENKISQDTYKKCQDKLEKLNLITIEVLRSVAGRPNRITLTDKGKEAIEKLLELQKILAS